MEKENTSNENETSQETSQEENNEKKDESKKKDKSKKKQKKEKTKTGKKPIWKKILSVLGTIFISALLLNFILLNAFTYSISTNSSGYLFSALLTLLIIFLIPKTNTIIESLIKNFSEKKKKIFKIIKIVFFVLRGQFLLAFIIFTGYLILKDSGRPYQEIFEHFSNKIVFPISPMKMNRLLELIEKNDAVTADKNLRDIDKYKKRVNIPKLAAHNIEYSYERAKQFIEKNEIENAIKEIDQAFSLFNSYEYLVGLDSTDLDTLTLFKYLSPNVLSNIANDYLKWSDGKTGSRVGLISNIAILNNPNHPQLTLLTANKEWEQCNVHKARESYRKYVNEIEKEGRGNEIPENIRKIVNFDPGFSKTKLLTVYDWTLQKRSSEMYCHLFQYLCNNHSYFADYFPMFINPDNNESKNIYDIYKFISGNDVYSQKATNTGVKINSSFVIWAKNNLIPSPNSEVGGVFCTEIYKNRFRDLCRAYASTYLYLNSLEGGFDQQVQDLHYAMEEENFYGVRYYYNTYRRIWPKNSEYTNSTAYDIFGWWLRRGAGGSAQEFWSALEKILYDYDSDWYNKAKNDLPSVIDYNSSGEDYMDEYFSSYDGEEEYDEYGEDYEEGDGEYEGEGEGEYEDEGGVYYSVPGSSFSGLELIRFILDFYQDNAFTINDINMKDECKNNIEFTRFRKALIKSLAYYTFANIVNLQKPASAYGYIRDFMDTDNFDQYSSTFRRLLGNLRIEQAREEFPQLIASLSIDDKKNFHKLSEIVISTYDNYQNSTSPDEDESCFLSDDVYDDVNMNIQGSNRIASFHQLESHNSYFKGFWERRTKDGTIDDVIEILKLTESLLSEY